MGDPTGTPDETPHKVTITKPFFIGAHEVSNSQWTAVMGSSPSKWKDDDRRVEQVTWGSAVEFCKKLSDLPVEKRAGRVYRLPTEAEWEYACRAGSQTKYCFGDDESMMNDFGVISDNSEDYPQEAFGFLREKVKRPHRISAKKPNAWGIFGMHGNVWEWCSDWYGNYADGRAIDPQGPIEGVLRIRRGGSYSSPAEKSRSGARGRANPVDRSSTQGFRVVAIMSEP